MEKVINFNKKIKQTDKVKIIDFINNIKDNNDFSININKLSTLKVKRSKKVVGGEYNKYQNCIEIENDLDDGTLEFGVLNSLTRGFYYEPFSNGTSEYLVEKYCSDQEYKTTELELEKFFVNCAALIIGDEALEKYYFNADTFGLLEDLSNNEYYHIIKNFLKDLDNRFFDCRHKLNDNELFIKYYNLFKEIYISRYNYAEEFEQALYEKYSHLFNKYNYELDNDCNQKLI